MKYIISIKRDRRRREGSNEAAELISIDLNDGPHSLITILNGCQTFEDRVATTTSFGLATRS